MPSLIAQVLTGQDHQDISLFDGLPRLASDFCDAQDAKHGRRPLFAQRVLYDRLDGNGQDDDRNDQKIICPEPLPTAFEFSNFQWLRFYKNLRTI